MVCWSVRGLAFAGCVQTWVALGGISVLVSLDAAAVVDCVADTGSVQRPLSLPLSLLGLVVLWLIHSMGQNLQVEEKKRFVCST